MQWMYLLCITNLVTNNKNKLYFLLKVGLENKLSQIRFQSKWGTMNKYVGSCLLLFCKFFKIYRSIFFYHPMDVPLIYHKF